MEGLFRIDIFDIWKHKMNAKFADFLTAGLIFKNEKERNAVGEKIKKFYFNGKEVGDQTILEYINYFSDIFFACPTLISIKHQLKANNNQIYLYEYSYVDDDTPLVPHTNIRGANHIAQSLAVLDGDEVNISKDLKEMKRILRDLWLNFIIKGKPESPDIPTWRPVGADWSPHMELKKGSELKGSLLKERCRFWEEIHNKYYLAPAPPTSFSSKNDEL